MFGTFNLSLDIFATVLAAFPNIGQIFVQLSGHSGYKKWNVNKALISDTDTTLPM
jgi:hypothetical protein